MTEEDVLRVVRELLTTNFDVPEEAVVREATFRGTLGLDSLDVVDFIFFLQKRLGYQAPLHDYRALETVGALLPFVCARVAAAAAPPAPGKGA